MSMQGMYNTFYDVGKMALWADKGDRAKAPRLTYSFRDGNPRFTVHTGEEAPNYQGEMKPVTINFPCSLMVFYSVMEAIKRVADGEPGYKESINSKTNVYVDGQRTEQKRIVSTFNVGKTKEGIVTILIKEDKKPDIAFAFVKNEWHDHTHSNQEEMSDAEQSKIYAKAYCFLITNSLSIALMEYTRDSFTHGEYKPYVIQPFEPNKGKPKGKQSYGSKGTQQAISNLDEYDENLPF